MWVAEVKNTMFTAMTELARFVVNLIIRPRSILAKIAEKRVVPKLNGALSVRNTDTRKMTIAAFVALPLTQRRTIPSVPLAALQSIQAIPDVAFVALLRIQSILGVRAAHPPAQAHQAVREAQAVRLHRQSVPLAALQAIQNIPSAAFAALLHIQPIRALARPIQAIIIRAVQVRVHRLQSAAFAALPLTQRRTIPSAAFAALRTIQTIPSVPLAEALSIPSILLHVVVVDKPVIVREIIALNAVG